MDLPLGTTFWLGQRNTAHGYFKVGIPWNIKSELKWLRDWIVFYMMRGWEIWNFSTWRSEGTGGMGRILSMWINTWICVGNEDKESRLFSLAPTDRPRSSGQNLKHLKFHLNIRKQFCCEVCQRKTTIEIFKSCLYTVLGNLLWLVLLEQGSWSRWSQGCLPTSTSLCFCNHNKALELLWNCSLAFAIGEQKIGY